MNEERKEAFTAKLREIAGELRELSPELDTVRYNNNNYLERDYEDLAKGLDIDLTKVDYRPDGRTISRTTTYHHDGSCTITDYFVGGGFMERTEFAPYVEGRWRVKSHICSFLNGDSEVRDTFDEQGNLVSSKKYSADGRLLADMMSNA